ncbi:succinate-semialdehyde dehydrogenase, mitochondrial [Trichonephila clavipes]|nr:succinate-semialdehyde dehydrogenase, mitochondrial [Trichonephila clavipes]
MRSKLLIKKQSTAWRCEIFGESSIHCFQKTELLKMKMLSNNILKCRFKYILLGYKRKYSFSIPEGKTYINGKWITAKNGKSFPVFNPANGNTIANVPDCGIVETDEAVEAACIAFKTWKDVTAKERAAFLRRMFELQMKNSEILAHIITSEGGKPLAESAGEINYGASFFEWFSEEARRIYGDIVPSPFKNKQMFFLREPVGVAGIITPWNFPNAMITRKVAAALAAGCTCVLKPAEDTPLSALAIAQLAEEAKVPPGVINVVTSSRSNTPSIGKRLCENPNVSTISFTGSTPVGKFITVGEKDILRTEDNVKSAPKYNLVALHFKYDQARRRFVEWAQNEIAVVPDFHKRILFSDEAHFWLNGYVNKQNCRIWSEANPQVYVETPLHPEKLTVWCALWAGGILLQKR